MDLIWIILAILISAAAVFLTAFLILRQFLQNERAKTLLELRMQNQKLLTPIRLQAYERIVLFLERIAPTSLILRVHQPGMNALQFQTALIKGVREEFDHNLSQQVYISNAAWELVRNAKEETIKTVHIAASKLNDQASGNDLSTTIIEITMQAGQLPGKKALDYIKEEIRQLF
jgi:uncharacterized protein YjaZ